MRPVQKVDKCSDSVFEYHIYRNTSLIPSKQFPSAYTHLFHCSTGLRADLRLSVEPPAVAPLNHVQLKSKFKTCRVYFQVFQQNAVVNLLNSA
jgi:hypothetical protein